MSKTKTAICKELIKDYCANCTFAGIHYIADDTKHITERYEVGHSILPLAVHFTYLDAKNTFNNFLISTNPTAKNN